ncbi:MAG: hypothetical protein AAFY00_03855 [Bacteroidota bacterium]
MKYERFLLTLTLLFGFIVTAQQPFYSITAGNGNGFRLWNSDKYKIHMGNTSEYKYGPVTDYSIKMNMNPDTSRGWTWGIDGVVPIAGLNTQGNFQIAGYLNAHQYITVSKLGSYRVGLNGQNDGYIVGRNDAVEDKFRIHSNGNSFLNGGNVGIGTSSPSQKLEIFNPNLFNTNMEAQSQDHISFTSNTAGLGNFFGGLTWRVGSRRRAAISAVQEHTDSDHVGLAFFTRGTDGPGPMYESVRITRNGSMGIGTTIPDAKLTVKGNIHAEEVKVDLSVPGPDYVFKEDYDLKSLEEVQNYIRENGHLPNIPSAKDMEENGIQLGEMNMKLLEKIEELTLYILELKTEQKVLKRDNDALKLLIEQIDKK